MQVLLIRSQFRQDLHCAVCGQGFRLYWELTSSAERATMRNIVLGELRDHHSPEQGGDPSSTAHPAELFRAPTWLGSPRFSRAAPPSHTSPSHTSSSHTASSRVALRFEYAK